MLDTLAGFVGELRRSGLPVSTTENIDAMHAAAEIPLEDREALRWALASTLVKRQEHRAAFDTVFDVWFSLRLPLLATDDALTAGELATLLDQALESGDDELLRELARQAVARLGGMHAGRPVGATFYVFRTLRQLDAEGALERLLAGAGVGAGFNGDELAGRLERDELRARLDRLRAEIEDEVRRRLVGEQGPEAVVSALRRPLPADVDFLHASPDDLAALRRTLQPLARRMAARLARKRRHHLRALLGHQPAADLGLDLRPQAVEAGPQLVPLQALVEPALGAGGGQQSLQRPLGIELAQRPEHVEHCGCRDGIHGVHAAFCLRVGAGEIDDCRVPVDSDLHAYGNWPFANAIVVEKIIGFVCSIRDI